MNKEPVKMVPGDDLHLTLLMAPQGLNFVTGKDREHLLAFGRAAFDAGQTSKCLHQIAEPAATHPDDAAVDNLAAAMKAKLAKQRAKGYGGWDTDCTQEHLSNLLRAHVNKGDPVDVANFCAFLLTRGEGIATTQPAALVLAAREFPPMTPELASILGLMCFQCISFAQALRAAGHTIKTSAEDEQAAVLHWMLGRDLRLSAAVVTHWRTVAAEDMKRMEAEALAAQAKQGGAA